MNQIDIEELIKKIVQETGMSKGEIEEKMRQKQADLKGLIKEEAALVVVAKELGVDVTPSASMMQAPKSDSIPHIKIKDIRPAMQNITLIGKVMQIFPVKEFTKKKDGSIGKVASFILQDETGEIRFTLWDNHTQIIEERRLAIGDTIRALNVIAKANRDGVPELSLTTRGKLELNPSDVTIKGIDLEQLPFTKISQISLSQRTLNCAGTVIQKFDPREFNRNGKKGRVGSIILKDETGTIRVAFWTENMKFFDKLEVGNEIEILGVIPKQNSFRAGQIEVNLRPDSIMKKTGTKKIDLDTEVKINQINNGLFLVNVTGIVGSIEGYKEITRKDGTTAGLFSFTLVDATGQIRVTAWDDKATELKEIKEQQSLQIKGARVKDNPTFNRIELSLGKSTVINFDIQIEKSNINLENLQTQTSRTSTSPKKDYIPRRVEDIQPNEFVALQGVLIKNLDRIFIYEACPVCNKKLENCTCGQEKSPVPRMIISATFDDGSDTVRITFFGNTAEQLVGKKATELHRFVNTPELDEEVNKLSKNIVGKEMQIRGQVKVSNLQQDNEPRTRTELTVNSFNFINPVIEANKILSEFA